MKRTVAYIDGYNLYYGILKGTPHKWLDPVRLVKALLRDDHELVSVKYFTSPVKTYPHDGAALDRQKVYMQALSTLPNVGAMPTPRHNPIRKAWRPLHPSPARLAVAIHIHPFRAVILRCGMVNSGKRDVYCRKPFTMRQHDLHVLHVLHGQKQERH